MNKCFLKGRLTRNPEPKILDANTKVLNFTLAVDRKYKKKDSAERLTDFIQCVAWNGVADFIAKYYSRGQCILIEGHVHNRSFEQDGERKTVTEIQVLSTDFAGAKPGADSCSDEAE